MESLVLIVFLHILGAYIIALLYLNAKVKTGIVRSDETKLPDNLRPLHKAVSAFGMIFFLPLLFLFAVVVLICLISGCDFEYSYTFPSIELNVWRDILPEDDDEEGRYFWTIGIGKKGYYSESIKQ